MSSDGLRFRLASVRPSNHGADMFFKKKIPSNRKIRQKSSSTGEPPELPMIEHSGTIEKCRKESPVVFIGIEEYLSNISSNSCNHSDSTLTAARAVTAQLEDSMILLSLRSYVSSNFETVDSFQRLVDMAYRVVNAENVYLLEVDIECKDFVITHSHVRAAVGMRLPILELFSGMSTNFAYKKE
jgi:hypothetical protein